MTAFSVTTPTGKDEEWGAAIPRAKSLPEGKVCQQISTGSSGSAEWADVLLCGLLLRPKCERILSLIFNHEEDDEPILTPFDPCDRANADRCSDVRVLLRGDDRVVSANAIPGIPL